MEAATVGAGLAPKKDLQSSAQKRTIALLLAPQLLEVLVRAHLESGSASRAEQKINTPRIGYNLSVVKILPRT
jgi:hypothetical protein